LILRNKYIEIYGQQKSKMLTKTGAP